MKFKSNWRKWARAIHRDLSYFFTGMVIIYAVSGIVMNHRDTINPNFSIERREFVIAPTDIPAKPADVARVTAMLRSMGEEANYLKHYFPTEGVLKVFLKGNATLVVEQATGKAVYECMRKRPLIGAMARLHYNPGKWWTVFADLFGVALIVITLSGIVMLKGSKGIVGRGGVELIAGIAVPLLFLLFG